MLVVSIRGYVFVNDLNARTPPRELWLYPKRRKAGRTMRKMRAVARGSPWRPMNAIFKLDLLDCFRFSPRNIESRVFVLGFLRSFYIANRSSKPNNCGLVFNSQTPEHLPRAEFELTLPRGALSLERCRPSRRSNPCGRSRPPMKRL